MSYAPFRTSTQTYKGTSFGFSFTINEDGSPLDLTTLDKVEVSLFSPSTEVFTFDTEGSLNISGSDNEIVSGEADKDTMDIGLRVYYMELRLYFADDTKEVYAVVDNTVIGPGSDESQGAHDWVLDIDNDSETVSGQVTSLYAETVALNQDTQAIKDSIEWKGAWDSNTTYAEDNRVSYQGESFISLQDGNQGNTPVGDSNDSFWDILAEKGQDGADGDFSDVENVQDLDSISGNTEIDLDNGTIIQATLTGSITLSFTGLPSANTVYNFTLVFSGAETITYPSGTEFAGGSAPSIIGPDYELPCSIDSAGNLTVYGIIDEIA